MSAGIAGLTHVLTDAALADLNARGDRLREELNRVAADRDVPVHTSGRGSLMTIHPGPRAFNAAEPPTRGASWSSSCCSSSCSTRGTGSRRAGCSRSACRSPTRDCAAFVAAFDAILARHADLLRAAC